MSIRLIDTTTLRLKVFTGRKVPRYAILSHTWEDDQEVSFQEMTSINKDLDCLAANKTGYVKIVQTCAKAAKHGFRHVWVDTCCIDKTSSAELSEAINSMYKWYKQAEVCYVFLRDFRDDNLSACRWFTRGWCLQELIAPLDLRFYDSDWAYIGSKASLRSAISEITGIEPEVLVDSRLIPTIPIARRMSWASFRDTSREEDIAYCLLGIFDINMPMLYGEGTKAFMRLQEEIIKKSNDLSIFAFDEPRYGQLGLGSWYFDLFAASPDNFRNCTNLVNTTGDVLPRNSFSLTNSGLRFGQVQLKVDVHRAEYILDLGCSKPGVDENLALFLRKADAGIFAKKQLRVGE
ncbi:heterokaryon incompatibility protein-domain-containing protein [Xylariaceae sp. FL1651]|nr:heterokaryon incompatibility protein-domain-containing protein [Xylariaceae sp. FL1651]